MKKLFLRGVVSLSLVIMLSTTAVFTSYAEEPSMTEKTSDIEGISEIQEVPETEEVPAAEEISEPEQFSEVEEVSEGEDVENTDVIEEAGDTEETSAKIETQTLGEIGAEIVLSKSSYTYTGASLKPTVQVTYTSAGDSKTLDASNYSVTYSNNVNVGQAKVTVQGKEENGYTGTLTAYFKITAKSLKGLKPSLKSKTYSYTGKNIKPTVTLKDGKHTLKSGKDYTVSYSSCCSIGTAKATIKGKGNYSGTLTTSYSIKLGTPQSFKTTPSYSSVKVSWKKVTGATGYAVYRSTSSSGKYTRIATIKSGSTTSYTNKNLKFNKNYYYKVKAYRKSKGKTIYSSSTKALKQKVQVATPSITKTSSASYSSIKVTWKKVSGASGYRVYRSTSKNGKYTALGSTKYTSFTDKKRTTGKVYYYKVKAYRRVKSTNYYGNYSSVKTGKSALSRAAFSSTSSRTQSYTSLKWNTVSGASGYEIVRSLKSGSGYQKLKTITKGNTTKWSDKSVDEKKTYYYKIRAYRTVSGKKVYGSYSTAFKANEFSSRLNYVKKQTKVPYRYGGTSTRGWDCSGFTKWAVKYLGGVDIPRTSGQQAKGGKAVSVKSRSSWKAGDVLVYSSGGRVSHVAIYLGNGQLMHALNSKYDTLIQGVDYYENWDKGNRLTAVRRYF